jgi:Transcriptional regulatory protein, C terminal
MRWRLFFILITVSFIIMAVYSNAKESSLGYSETKEMIVLRKVVHELLLSSGDSVSRVLPVKQLSAAEFHLFPEKPFAVQPDSFVNIVNRTIKAGLLTRNFTANVVKYRDKEVVYGFAASPVADENVITCLGRALPQDRYYLQFVFSETGIPWSSYFYFGGAAVALMLSFFLIKNKKLKKAGAVIAADPIVNENSGKVNHIQIGKYYFDAAGECLELNGDKTELTIKECKVLYILANAQNTMVERELLQKEVWENEGVIVTRSLDMFVSKLRKKLSGDPDIKIVNVHGKGYRLSVPGV